MTTENYSYLQVVIDIQDDDGADQSFQLYMHELLPAFTAGPWPGWGLYLSAKHDPDRTSASTNNANLQYLHIWRVRDLNSLPYLMKQFADNPIYRKLDALVLTENQNFAGGVSYDPGRTSPTQPSSHAKFFLRLETALVQDSSTIGQFETYMEDLTDCADWTNHGWTQLVYATYAQTGPLRRYTHIWSSTQAMPEAEAAIKWLSAQPNFSRALDVNVSSNLEWDVWEPVNYT